MDPDIPAVEAANRLLRVLDAWLAVAAIIAIATIIKMIWP